MIGRVEAHSPYALASLAGERPPAPAWFHEALATPCEVVPLEYDGVPLELLTWGEIGKPGLMLLHGNNAHARWWSPLAPLLARDYRVAAVSWSGMGGSGWRPSYSVAGYAREAMAAARAAGLFAHSPPVFVAPSFAGSCALEAARDRGGELRGVILVDSLLEPLAGKPIIPPRASHPVYPSEAAALARFRLAPPQPCSNLWYMDWIARHGLRPVLTDGRDAGARTWRIDPVLWQNLEWHDKWHAFQNSRCPLVVLRGASSRLVTPEAFAVQIAEAPPGTHFETIEGAGHHIMLDQPLVLLEAIRRLAAQF